MNNLIASFLRLSNFKLSDFSLLQCLPLSDFKIWAQFRGQRSHINPLGACAAQYTKRDHNALCMDVSMMKYKVNCGKFFCL